MRTNNKLESILSEYVKSGVLLAKQVNNPYIKIMYKGAGNAVPSNWNVQIFTSGKLHTNDGLTLSRILDRTIENIDPQKLLIQCDDAGVGFPLCGAMIGIFDGKEITTDVVDVSFFQPPAFKQKLYLTEYSSLGIKILQKIGATPQTHRIEICIGHINSALKNALRDQGYDVRISEITGPLQDGLEMRYRLYIRNLIGVDLAYDPKLTSKKEMGKKFYTAVNWAKKNGPHFLKSGWELS
jgi:hypothetical protein